METKKKNRIITISGEPASGKGTTVKALKQYYEEKGFDVHVISVGDIFREISVEEYKKDHPEIEQPTIEQINNDKSFASRRGEIDRNIDAYVARKGQEISSSDKPNDVYIFDSRLAFSNIPDSFDIRLTVAPTIAGNRVFVDDSRGGEEEYENLEDAIEKTEKRNQGEVARYKKRYGVDLTNEDNYDLVIDTSYSTTDDVIKTIILCEERKRENLPFAKKWASPKRFLPLQDIRDTGGGWYKNLNEFEIMIREEGYDPKEAIKVIRVDGIDYIYEGHHRNFASAANGMTLIPYEIIATDDEKLPMQSVSARERVYANLKDRWGYLSTKAYPHEDIFRTVKNEKGEEIDPEFTYEDIYGKYPEIKEKEVSGDLENNQNNKNEEER